MVFDGIFKKKTPAELKFEELTNTVGYAMAVAICENILPEKFWEKLTIEQRIEICKSANGNNGLIKKAMAHAIEAAITADDCVILYNAIPDPAQKAEILKKAMGFAGSTEECLGILGRIDYGEGIDDATREIGMGKAIDLAESIEDCNLVTRSWWCDKEFYRRAAIKTVELATTYLVCLNVYNREQGADVDQLALEKAFSLAAKFEDCSEAMCLERITPELKDKFAEKGIKYANYTRLCLIIRNRVSNPQIRKKAEDKAVLLATSRDAWMRISGMVEEPDIKKEMLEKAIWRIDSLEECGNLYANLDEKNAEFKLQVLIQARKLADIASIAV